MKIAFINIYQGAVDRGAETYVSEISKRLGKKFEVKVYALAENPRKHWPFLWRAYLDPHGLQTLWSTLKLTPSLWKEKYDIVVPVNGGWQPALVRLITWLYGGKMVISGQSGIGWDDRNNLWCFPDCFIALTDYTKKWASRVNPYVRVENIPNGVDVNKFAGEKSSLKLNLERPIIISVGTSESKRQDLAIRAVSKLEKGSLLIVGKSENDTNLRELGDKLLGKRFMLTNYAFFDMPKVYKSVDLFTFPTSPSESFGITILEAMASGLPVVVSDDPIRREIGGSGAVYVNPADANIYARVLEKSLSMAKNAKSYLWAKRFDWDVISEKYEELFVSLIK